VQYSFRSFFAAFSFFFVLLFLTGCAGSVQKSTSGTPGTPTQSGGTLTVSATSLNFQTVTVGQTGSQALQLTNSGSSAVTVSAMTISTKPFTLSGAAAPVTIQPSASVSYTVVFAPTAAGNDTATLNITSSASSAPLVVSLSGSGAATSSAQHAVKLNWNASSTPGVGYIVYRSENSGGPFSPLFGTSTENLTYQDSTVASGSTYYYVVTSVDTAGTESIYSNQVTAAIP
jgi:Abnormal spindle-like microcephaly-assoc'd, ASPM-SPD-2-Hydin